MRKIEFLNGNEYDEKKHAFIIGLFFWYLKEHGEQGVRVFVKASQHYAEQRGNRMALRALRDGHKLDFDTYLAYGEWNPSPNACLAVTTEQTADSLVEKVSACPWACTFAKMNLKDCGLTYCREIDSGIIRGFNPELHFELVSMLHDSDFCIQVLKDYVPQKTIPAPEDGKRDWKYHCAHVLCAMSDTANAAGFSDTVEKVRKDIIEQCGEEFYCNIADTGIDFNLPG